MNRSMPLPDEWKKHKRCERPSVRAQTGDTHSRWSAPCSGSFDGVRNGCDSSGGHRGAGQAGTENDEKWWQLVDGSWPCWPARRFTVRLSQSVSAPGPSRCPSIRVRFSRP